MDPIEHAVVRGPREVPKGLVQMLSAQCCIACLDAATLAMTARREIRRPQAPHASDVHG
jgi:hypothetical protein